MATIPPGHVVSIRASALAELAYAPPGDLTLAVAVHEAALNAPNSPHTQLVGLLEGELCWAGALAEHLLVVEATHVEEDPRQALWAAMGVGARLWDVVWPGELVRDPGRSPLSTLYLGARPWLVIGELQSGDLLAAPLNDATNPRWFTPVLAPEDVLASGRPKECQLELAHVWSLPPSLGADGTVAEAARERLLSALFRYF